MRTFVKGFVSVVALITSALLLPGCKIVKGFAYMNKKHVSVYDLGAPGKTVKMIPIMHFGTNSFYNDLKEKIVKYKSEGFVVYYEQMRANRDRFTISDEEYATLRRKYRKVTGGGASRAKYDELRTAFKNKRAQPLYKDLGITESDVNADISIQDLVNQYELRYGPVTLDSCDLNTALNADYDCGSVKNSLKPIRIDYRNQNVANMIKSSPDKRILIVYGYGHKKGIRKLLKK